MQIKQLRREMTKIPAFMNFKIYTWLLCQRRRSQLQRYPVIKKNKSEKINSENRVHS